MKMPKDFIKKMSDKILNSLQQDEELKQMLQKDVEDYNQNKNEKETDNNEG